MKTHSYTDVSWFPKDQNTRSQRNNTERERQAVALADVAAMERLHFNVSGCKSFIFAFSIRKAEPDEAQSPPSEHNFEAKMLSSHLHGHGHTRTHTHTKMRIVYYFW